MTTLANRLPTYILHELVKSCPHTLEPLINWLDHCGFWLEELNQHPRTPDQVPFMIGLLGLAVSREAGWPVHTATAELRNYMRLYQDKEGGFMTNQEAFETMVRHAREQGRKSLNRQGKCRYRGQNGTKCFVGALIPDAEYTVMLEGKPAMSLLRMLPCLHGLSPDLLDRMQAIHDRDEMEVWESAFSTVSHIFALALPPLEEASHA